MMVVDVVLLSMVVIIGVMIVGPCFFWVHDMWLPRWLELLEIIQNEIEVTWVFQNRLPHAKVVKHNYIISKLITYITYLPNKETLIDVKLGYLGE